MIAVLELFKIDYDNNLKPFALQAVGLEGLCLCSLCIVEMWAYEQRARLSRGQYGAPLGSCFLGVCLSVPN